MIIFVSNFLNHHQFPVASELYTLTGGQYRFVETEPMPEWIKKGGYSEYDNLPWLIQAWKSPEADKIARELIISADTVMWCNNLYIHLIKERLKQGKLTFEIGERWLKRGLLNLLSPRLIKSQFYYHSFFRNRPLYRLNASAYAANDMRLMHSFRNKMFKWGYFTKCKENVTKPPQTDNRLRILWVARFLTLKHPELPVKMASMLRQKGYDFELDMYGQGPEFERVKALINSLKVSDVVKLKGVLPNEDILKEMRDHQIFLFSSDRHEGWGAVLNEAMSNKCAVVASHEIGSVPFLIKHNENGLIFRSKSVDDLCDKVQYLLENPQKCIEFGEKAFTTIYSVWSPKNAARNLLKLISSLEDDSDSNIDDGPCSVAHPVEWK